MSMGLEGAYGADAFQQRLRQQILEQLSAAATQHAMSTEDQKLQIEKDRFAQEAADRALLRQQQGQAFNETLAEKTGANLGAGPSIISPDLGKRFLNTSLAPLVSPDQTLPSTSMAAGSTLPGSESASTAPAVTQNAPQLTGQLRFSGLPALNKQAADEATIAQMASDPKTPPAIRGFLQIRQALPKGENIDYHLITEPNGPPKPGEIKDTQQGLVRVGPDNTVTPVMANGRQVQPYHAPVQPVIVQTDNGFASVNRGSNTATPVTDAAGTPLKPKVGQTMESRLQSAQAVVQTGNDIAKVLSDPTVAAKLGPVLSRYNSIADFVGNPPPEFNNLAGLIESYSLANMGVHGMRANTGAEAIKQTLGLGRHTPESMLAALQGLNGFANHLLENNNMPTPVASHGVVGPVAPASAGWKVLN